MLFNLYFSCLLRIFLYLQLYFQRPNLCDQSFGPFLTDQFIFDEGLMGKQEEVKDKWSSVRKGRKKEIITKRYQREDKRYDL